MSEDFEPSPRATKRRRTTRYSDQSNHVEDGRQDDVDAPTDDPVGEGQVDSDTIEVHRSRETPKHPNKRFTGRRTKNHPDNVEAVLSSNIEVSTPTADRTETRGPSSRKIGSGQKESDAESLANNKTHVEDPKEASNVQATRSSGRSRRAPKRLAESLDEQTPSRTINDQAAAKRVAEADPRAVSPTPKGILTPSKKQKSRAQKSVAFNHEEKEIGDQLGFRDINTPAPKKLPKKSTPYPSKSLNLTKIRDLEVVTIEGDEQDPVLQSDAEPLLIDDTLDTIPIPEIIPASKVILNDKDEDPLVLSLKHKVLSRLASSSLPTDPPAHLDSQYKQVHSLLKATIASSESNSLLLLGPRGGGKTMLLELALRELGDEFQSDFHTVRLNGFLQTDDRLALREIWRQLGHSRNLDEAETEDIGASYADTMASLLSLLSHIDEMDVDHAEDNAGQRTSKSIVFILDEFDLFTTHPRQTLLYNLFDIAQSRKAPIVVVGCSSRMDVIECLEKRVKSRFSHRWLLIPGCKSFSEWEVEVKNALTVRPSEGDLSRLTDQEVTCNGSWNESIETTFLMQEPVKQLIKREFYTTKSLPQLYMALYPLIAALEQGSTMNSEDKPGSFRHKKANVEVAISPSVLVTLVSLPVLHMSLLISMCRLEAIHTLNMANFNLVYTHYTELIDTSRLKQAAHGSVTHSGTLRKWNRELCREAWEELGIEGLIVPAAGGRDADGNSGGAEMEETRMWRSEVGLDDITWSVKEKFELHGQGGGGTGDVLVKWCKEA